MGQKHDQGSTCLAQSASGPVLQSLGLDAAPRTADRLSHQTRTYKQTSAKDKKQYTKQHKTVQNKVAKLLFMLQESRERKNRRKRI